MSYDMHLTKKGKTVMLNERHYIKGGTYQVGGTKEAWLNITYNYSPIFRECFGNEKGIKVLEGMTAKQSITVLSEAIAKLSPDDNRGPSRDKLENDLLDILNSVRLSMGTEKLTGLSDTPENEVRQVFKDAETGADEEMKMKETLLNMMHTRAVSLLTRLRQVDPVTNTAPAVYWDCTPANARESLVLLLLLATLAPEDSVWMID